MEGYLLKEAAANVCSNINVKGLLDDEIDTTEMSIVDESENIAIKILSHFQLEY